MVASQTPNQSYDWPGASEVTLKNMGKGVMWIYYELII